MERVYAMFLQRGSRALRHQWRLYKGVNRFVEAGVCGAYAASWRGFHGTRRLQVVKPVLLADIGEGNPLMSLACLFHLRGC